MQVRSGHSEETLYTFRASKPISNEEINNVLVLIFLQSDQIIRETIEKRCFFWREVTKNNSKIPIISTILKITTLAGLIADAYYLGANDASASLSKFAKQKICN